MANKPTKQPSSDEIVAVIEQCESAISRRDYQMAMDLYAVALEMNSETETDFSGRLEDLEATMLYR
ncbi:MAG TPA: hypothetical protein VMC07_01325 [Candidatus Omnitrophota bacterium]|nr:hypothetical protein [Candidatus Omnitrophota bacterium]